MSVMHWTEVPTPGLAVEELRIKIIHERFSESFIDREPYGSLDRYTIGKHISNESPDLVGRTWRRPVDDGVVGGDIDGLPPEAESRYADLRAFINERFDLDSYRGRGVTYVLPEEFPSIEPFVIEQQIIEPE